MLHRFTYSLLTLAILVYIGLFSWAAFYKYDSYLMGFDLGVHEQVLWNTAHGRFAATSAFAATESYLGIDMIPTELLLAPIYRLFPTTSTLLLLQTIAVALGALPVFLIVRRRFELQATVHRPPSTVHRPPSTDAADRRLATANWAGLVFALGYLLYLPVEYANLYEFQIRTFATTLLLAAFWAWEQRRAGWFWLWALLALGCRNEVGLVLAGMGVYAIADCRLQIADWPRAFLRDRTALLFGLLPIVVGLAWVVLSLQVLIPYFRGGAPSLYLALLYGQFPDGTPWLGDSPGAIITTLLTRPGFVLGEVFGGARGAARLTYLLQMFVPFALLPLLQPRLLLITLPIFGLNLLSSTPNIHASIRFHYQALIVPFIVIAAAYGLAALGARGQGSRVRQWVLQRFRLPSSVLRLPVALALLLALFIACNLWLRNPLFTLLTRPIAHERVAAAERLLAQVPADAPLTVTNTLGPHAARRQQLYFFPGNVIYPREKVTRGEYLLIDDAPEQIRPAGRVLLDELVQTGQYQKLAEEGGVSLWQRQK